MISNESLFVNLFLKQINDILGLRLCLEFKFAKVQHSPLKELRGNIELRDDGGFNSSNS